MDLSKAYSKAASLLQTLSLPAAEEVQGLQQILQKTNEASIALTTCLSNGRGPISLFGEPDIALLSQDPSTNGDATADATADEEALEENDAAETNDTDAITANSTTNSTTNANNVTTNSTTSNVTENLPLLSQDPD